MISFLLQPYPSFYPSRHAVMQCGIAGISVLLVLFVLQPFGMDHYTTGNRLLAATGYGVVTFIISVLFTCLLPLVLPKLFDEANWNVAREILFFIAITGVIAVGNLFFSHIIDGTTIQYTALLRSTMVTYSVAFIPVLLAIFFKQQKLFRKYKAESMQLNELLHQVTAPANEEIAIQTSAINGFSPQADAGKQVLFAGGSQQDSLSIPTDDLLFISAADNYVRVSYTSQEKINQAIMRGTLTKVEEQLSPYGFMLRCHRGYIVNLCKVTAVSGNAQGYKLHIAGLEEPVPVGRNYNAVIKDKLQHLRD